jgi:hypothetical protein
MLGTLAEGSGMFNVRALVLLAAVLTPTLAQAEDLAPVALNSLSSRPADIASFAVMDQNGQIIGHALRIQNDQDGKPAALSFQALDGRTVVISAAATSFDGHEFITSNDQPQIAGLSSLRTAAK